MLKNKKNKKMGSARTSKPYRTLFPISIRLKKMGRSECLTPFLSFVLSLFFAAEAFFSMADRLFPSVSSNPEARQPAR
jgi:hypothetical protein